MYMRTANTLLAKLLLAEQRAATYMADRDMMREQLRVARDEVRNLQASGATTISACSSTGTSAGRIFW